METVSLSVGEKLSCLMPMRSKSHNSVNSNSGLDSQIILVHAKFPVYVFDDSE